MINYMKNLFLTLALVFTFNATSQIAVMTAVDLKDGAEDDYLKLEKFYSAIPVSYTHLRAHET